jgi:peroxiredoxin
MRADIVVGAVFPDYELTDHTGKHRKLSDLQGPDPMILVLSRGGYCPKDRRQAEGLVQLHHEMEVGYSRLVTISTDYMLLTNETEPVPALIGPFCQIRAAGFKRIST